MTDEDSSPAVLLASVAVSVCDAWSDPDTRRDQVLAYWRASFGSPPGLLLAAAERVAALPLPVSDAVKDIERMARFRDLTGATSPEEELVAIIDARALLEDLAREFG